MSSRKRRKLPRTARHIRDIRLLVSGLVAWSTKSGRHLLQEEFAELIGVKSHDLSRYERGIVRPPASVIRSIGMVFGVSPSRDGKLEVEGSPGWMSARGDCDVLREVDRWMVGLVQALYPDGRLPPRQAAWAMGQLCAIAMARRYPSEVQTIDVPVVFTVAFMNGIASAPTVRNPKTVTKDLRR